MKRRVSFSLFLVLVLTLLAAQSALAAVDLVGTWHTGNLGAWNNSSTTANWRIWHSRDPISNASPTFIHANPVDQAIPLDTGLNTLVMYREGYTATADAGTRFDFQAGSDTKSVTLTMNPAAYLASSATPVPSTSGVFHLGDHIVRMQSYGWYTQGAYARDLVGPTTVGASGTTDYIGVVGVNVVSAPGNPYENVVLANNPFAYYRFDGDTGLNGSQLTDFSGNSRHGTYQNNVPLEFGGPLTIGSDAAHFNGADNRAAGTTQQPATAITVEAWAKSDTPLWNNTGMMVSKRDAFILHPRTDGSGKQINFYIYSGGWNSIGFDLNTIAGFDLRDWHHYVGVYDPAAPSGQRLQFYVDGILRSTGGTLTGAINNSTQPVYIGFDNAGARWFDGMLDEVAIYDYALSADMIGQHYLAAAYTPEPSTLALLSLGALGLLAHARRRRRAAST